MPGGPSCRILLTRLSPSLRGGGAVGRWSLLFRSQPLKKDVKKKAHCEPDLLNSDLVTEEHHCHSSKLEMTSVPTR